MQKKSDMEYKQLVGEHIRIARNRLGLTQKQLSIDAKIPLPTLKDWEGGKRIPGGEGLAALIRIGINVNWLLEHSLPILIKEQGYSRTQPNPGIPLKELDEADYCSIPLYDVAAATGFGRVPRAQKPDQHLLFRTDWIHNKLHASPADLYLIYVEGDSMVPTLAPGDVLLVDHRDNNVQRDGIYVLVMDDALLVKRCQSLPGGEVRVSSDNPAYLPFNMRRRRLEPDVQDDADGSSVVGRVIWHGSRL